MVIELSRDGLILPIAYQYRFGEKTKEASHTQKIWGQCKLDLKECEAFDSFSRSMPSGLPLCYGSHLIAPAALHNKHCSQKNMQSYKLVRFML